MCGMGNLRLHAAARELLVTIRLLDIALLQVLNPVAIVQQALGVALASLNPPRNGPRRGDRRGTCRITGYGAVKYELSLRGPSDSRALTAGLQDGSDHVASHPPTLTTPYGGGTLRLPGNEGRALPALTRTR